jgi:hypothetical protein
MFVRTAAIALALVAAPVAAENDIVVRGQVLSKEEAAAQAKAFVQAVGIVSTVKPAARWIDHVCPKVSGIADPKVSARVVARIRRIATEAGAKIGKPGCRGNLMVAFTDDGGDLARRIGAANPRLMGQVPTNWRGQLVSGAEPVRWWYSFSIRGADGKPPMGR